VPVETTLASEPARDLSPQAALQVGLTLEALVQLRHKADLHPADVAVKRAEKVGKLSAILDGFPALRDALGEALAETTRGRSLDATEAARRLNALDQDGKPSDRFYNQIAPRLGGKEGGRWRFAEEAVEEYRRGLR